MRYLEQSESLTILVWGVSGRMSCIPACVAERRNLGRMALAAGIECGGIFASPELCDRKSAAVPVARRTLQA
jgi:hypothetical protein